MSHSLAAQAGEDVRDGDNQGLAGIGTQSRRQAACAQSPRLWEAVTVLSSTMSMVGHLVGVGC